MNSCNCIEVSDQGGRRNAYPVGMAYVPWQKFETTYEPDMALRVGTIFPELNLPFGGGRGMAK